MTTMQKRAAAGAAAALVLGGLAALTPGAAQAAPEDVVQVQILATNDFHGRILPSGAESGAAVIAGAVEELKADNPHTVFAAAGDLIGASTFESFVANDKPTIDALNAAGLDVSAVGNHEFDQGYSDLVNRVMAPYDESTNPEGGAEWEYIGANVKMKADGAQADGIEASWVQTFTEGDDTVEVGFVGAVTEHLDELVSPDGITEIEAVDIVESVNAEAADLKDEGADLVVLLVHEGASSTDYEDAVDPASDFGEIVTGVSDDVGAIVSGHTHLAYNHDVDGMPVVSAGQYGVNLNQLVFDIDAETGEVEVVTNEILPLMRNEPVDGRDNWIANYTPDAEVQQIVDEAKAEADVLGAVPIGELAAPFSRAKRADGTTENRGGESTLGNLVAEVQRAQTPESIGGAEIAFMNPGGLRQDMVGTDGVLTYKQAAVVQPFANTLVRMELTGAQIKRVLEEQWQPEGASRPFLRLGISEGFSYTYDPQAPKGERILDMWLDGEAIDPARSYAVTANSFLASGGDNFGTFAEGVNKQDTGVTDLQAMVEYMEANSPVAPDYRQRSVGITQVGPAEAGGVAQIELSSLAFSFPGDLKDEEIVVTAGEDEVGSFPVDATVAPEPNDETGTASIEVPLPEGLAPGETQAFTVTGAATGTTVTGRAMVRLETQTSLEIAPAKPVVGSDAVTLTATVTASGETPTGTVIFSVDGTEVGTADLVDGVATLAADALAAAGSHEVDAQFVGAPGFMDSAAQASLEVAKTKPKLTVKVKPKKVKAKKSKVKIVVQVKADGVKATGKIQVKANGKTKKVKVNKAGKAKVKVGKFKKAGKKKVVVKYLGDANLKKAKKKITFKVKR